MRRSFIKSLFTFVAFAALISVGCGGSKPSRFYMLQSAPNIEENSGGGLGEEVILFGLMPLLLPEYVYRPQIVTHIGEHEMEYAECDRWAEPLVGTLTRVVVASLRDQLDPVIFINYPWLANVKIEYRLHLELVQFDIYEDGNAVLDAKWAMGVGRGGEWLQYGFARMVEPFDEGKKADYAVRVAALNRLVERLNDKLAADIGAFLETRPSH
jgi:uncharacterized lipoprotein YmbA